MPQSKREQILRAAVTRLEAITVAEGFATDAGAAVFLGETPVLGDGDPDVAIAIVIGEDETRWQGEHVSLVLPLELQALAKGDWFAAEAVLADIKRAFELPDRTLGGLVKRQIERRSTRCLERAEGSSTVGISIGYAAPYTEFWGEP